jgi:hypothetical protein
MQVALQANANRNIGEIKGRILPCAIRKEFMMAHERDKVRRVEDDEEEQKLTAKEAADAAPLPVPTPGVPLAPGMAGTNPLIARAPDGTVPDPWTDPAPDAWERRAKPAEGSQPDAISQERYAETSGTAPSPGIPTPEGMLVSEIQQRTGVPGGALPAHSDDLAAGGGACVGSQPIGLRSEPAVEDRNITSELQAGMHLTLLDGPRYDGSREWWHVRAADGRTGWVDGGMLVAG